MTGVIMHLVEGCFLLEPLILPIYVAVAHLAGRALLLEFSWRAQYRHHDSRLGPITSSPPLARARKAQESGQGEDEDSDILHLSCLRPRVFAAL